MSKCNQCSFLRQECQCSEKLKEANSKIEKLRNILFIITEQIPEDDDFSEWEFGDLMRELNKTMVKLRSVLKETE